MNGVAVDQHMSTDETYPVGVTRMEDSEIRSFVSHRNVGVLGLPDTDTPYVIPMSYDFDGEDNLYFTFVLGEDSHKEDLSDRADRGSFLVYDATSAFIWESVAMTGEIGELSSEERAEVADSLGNAWRPDAFKNTDPSWETTLYRFRIRETVGLKGTGLPAGLEDDPGGDSSR
jgi:nitroimidazol reductase NimA-like FMN-containing flavoprotein (pyridoxamine 5'-phosphate oxidase superfamily)